MQSNVSTESARVLCPYCGARITLIIDPLENEEQTYTDDCEACCQPMVVTVSDAGDVSVIRESD